MPNMNQIEPDLIGLAFAKISRQLKAFKIVSSEALGQEGNGEFISVMRMTGTSVQVTFWLGSWRKEHEAVSIQSERGLRSGTDQ